MCSSDLPSDDLLVDTVWGVVVLVYGRRKPVRRVAHRQVVVDFRQGAGHAGRKKTRIAWASAWLGRHSEECVPGGLLDGGKHPGSHPRLVRSRGASKASLGRCHLSPDNQVRGRRQRRPRVFGPQREGLCVAVRTLSRGGSAGRGSLTRFRGFGSLSVARSSASRPLGAAGSEQRAKRGSFEEWALEGRARPSWLVAEVGRRCLAARSGSGCGWSRGRRSSRARETASGEGTSRSSAALSGDVSREGAQALLADGRRLGSWQSVGLHGFGAGSELGRRSRRAKVLQQLSMTEASEAGWQQRCAGPTSSRGQAVVRPKRDSGA